MLRDNGNETIDARERRPQNLHEFWRIVAIADVISDGRLYETRTENGDAFVSLDLPTEEPMERKCFATVMITSPQGVTMPPKSLGEFMTVWRKGVKIGADAGCDVALDGLPPVAAIVRAASNHKIIYQHDSPTFHAATVYTGGPIPPFGQRIDNRPFELHGYVVQFGEVDEMTSSPDAT